jgi:SAM-dependent MidA family methyltransferase
MRVELPEPNPDERAHSERVAALIRDEIAGAGGALDFARFMELALYAPGLGYYSAGSVKFGAAGDFVTAPELGFVFARCLARAVLPELREAGSDLLELGPGNGALAADLLLELERLGTLPQRYRLLERSADLRARQSDTLKQRCAHLCDRIEWLDAPPHDAWRGAVIANEVIDALPVRPFTLRDAGVFARDVAVDAQGDFVWRETAADTKLRAAIDVALGDTAAALPRPYSSEICTLLDPWFAEVTRTLERGSAWFVDYGYADGEYYAPQRNAGTLRCHYKHRAHDNPLILPGIQDITAWVDFAALARVARTTGFAVDVDGTQAQFLIAHGLDEVFAQAYAQVPDEAARYALAQQVKRLTLPSEMGERFRVMVLRR